MPDDRPRSFGVPADNGAPAHRELFEPVAGSECLKCSGLPDDPQAEMEDAFAYGHEIDELTEREIDALYVEEMERREREALSVGGPNSPAAGVAEDRVVAVRRGQFSGYSNDELIALIQAVVNNDPRLVDLGYTDTEERRRALFGEAMWEILTRLCPSPPIHPTDKSSVRCA